MFLCLRHIQKFFSGRGHQIWSAFKRSFFSTEPFCSVLKMKKALGGFGGMLPRKIFEHLHTVLIVAISVLFEQFLGKFCLNFLPLKQSVSPIMMHCSYSFDYACLGRKANCY